MRVWRGQAWSLLSRREVETTITGQAERFCCPITSKPSPSTTTVACCSRRFSKAMTKKARAPRCDRIISMAGSYPFERGLRARSMGGQSGAARWRRPARCNQRLEGDEAMKNKAASRCEALELTELERVKLENFALKPQRHQQQIQPALAAQSQDYSPDRRHHPGHHWQEDKGLVPTDLRAV